MMMRFFIALIVLTTIATFSEARAGDVALELGAGYHTSLGTPRYQWEDGGSAAFYGAIRWESDPIKALGGWQTFAQYSHHSQWWAPPAEESTLDAFYFGVRFSFANYGGR